MSQGTFDYQNRVGSKILSYIILALTVLITVLVRLIFQNSVLTLISFIAVLILLATIGVAVNKKLFIHEARYELTPDHLTIDAGKDSLSLSLDEVNGVGCDPVYDKKSKGTDTVKYWSLTILTVRGNFEYCSDNVIETNENNQVSIRQFQQFGKELKRWMGMS